MVLDEQSVKDRAVTLVHKTAEFVDVDGNVREDFVMGEEEAECLTERSVWRIHRIPYEEAVDFYLLLDVKPGMEGNEFLKELIRPGPEE